MKGENPPKKYHFSKPAVSRSECKKMSKKYDWRLEGSRQSSDPILKVLCDFESNEPEEFFPDMWGDNQD